ncbi:hypothetical protein KP509_15G070400 [Ceratopteris richardii]|nr:hypothetical protein KP509_15G070400 [Ceratopteris richardii]
MPQQDNNGDGVNGSFNGSGGDGGEGDDNGSYDYGGEGGDFSAFFLSAFFRGWNDRANADPHFSFKVFAEEMVSAGATAIAHVTSKKNDCLNELDFVFSAIAVGSILNFCLLYTLAPTSTLGAAPMIFPSMFSHSPPAQMSNRLVIFLNKSAIFTIAGVTQGLLSTIVPNLLIRMRKKLDPCKEVQAKPPPIALNAATCAINMGLGSTFRYQIVGDLEFVMAKVMPAPLVRVSIFGIRTMNIILGGIVFATLARLTGLQKDERGEKSAFVARVTGLQTAEKAEKSGKKADKQEP